MLAYRFDEWDKEGNKVLQTHAYVADWEVGKVVWEMLKQQNPYARLTWRHGALVHKEQPWRDRWAKG